MTLDAAPDGRGSTADRLLDVAAELFRLKGYDGTTTREIAERLQLQKGSLYHHIRSKEDLLERICSSCLERLHTEVSAAVSEAPPEERLRVLIARHVERSLLDRRMHAVMMMELRSLSDTHRAAVVAMRDQYQQLVFEVVHDEQVDGVLREDLDAHLMTLTLLGLMNWVIFWYRPEGRLTPQQLGDVLAEVFFTGAAAAPRASPRTPAASGGYGASPEPTRVMPR
jgi:TetR/AcrR family transcriptional regulator, cholesterol catabolism regulator